jgi:hypothetical protein
MHPWCLSGIRKPGEEHQDPSAPSLELTDRLATAGQIKFGLSVKVISTILAAALSVATQPKV